VLSAGACSWKSLGLKRKSSGQRPAARRRKLAGCAALAVDPAHPLGQVGLGVNGRNGSRGAINLAEAWDVDARTSASCEALSPHTSRLGLGGGPCRRSGRVVIEVPFNGYTCARPLRIREKPMAGRGLNRTAPSVRWPSVSGGLAWHRARFDSEERLFLKTVLDLKSLTSYIAAASLASPASRQFAGLLGGLVVEMVHAVGLCSARRSQKRCRQAGRNQT